jgi:hypothetical protein
MSWAACLVGLTACLVLWGSTSATAAVMSIHDPAALKVLETSGLSFAEVLTGHSASGNAEIASGHGYETIVTVLTKDLKRRARSDAKAGVGTRFAHRLFDARWLSSDTARFELVGVVNRLDRSAFSPGRCGETRLVYRLAYTRSDGLSSRLPMTVNVVYWQEGDSCEVLAERWKCHPDSGASLTRLQSPEGALFKQRLRRSTLKSVEVNLQSVRWPSTVHPSLGGHAEYLMRVFRPSGDGLAVAPLENTPDVVRLRKQPKLKADLLAWLRDPMHRDAIDTGTHVLPDRFLATQAVSVTPRGLARLSNRPFAQLYTGADLEAESPSQGALAGSGNALLRRLDGRTCVGCHQSRSLAGFHLPGEDPAEKTLDALAVGRSPHFIDDQPRRVAYLEAVALGEPPNVARGHAERGRYDGMGARCGLEGSPYTAWTCMQGLACRHVDDLEVGVCAAAGAGQVGEPCEPGRLRTKRAGAADRLSFDAPRACGPGLLCEGTSVGFPGGMCAAGCGSGSVESICGAIALLTPFNRCVARGEPFTRCLAEETRPAGLRRCDPDTPCRDDYLCARISGSTGACLPPYFLFQMRVDGH